MATTQQIVEQCRLIAEAYNSKIDPEGRFFEAYELALGDIDYDYLRRGVVAVLRERLEFRPTPAQVRAFANKAKDEDAKYRRQTDGKRLHCKRCMDAGCVFIVHPKWLLEHQRDIEPEWFVAGWRQEAIAWCKKNCRASFIVGVVCGCNCPKSETFVRQMEAKKDDPKKFAAFPQVFSDDRHCIIDGAATELIQEALLAWKENGGDARGSITNMPNYEPAFDGMDQREAW